MNTYKRRLTELSISLLSHQQRAFDMMQCESVGKIIIPTGGGKTYIMIADLAEQLRVAVTPLISIVVAPRILLSNQLHEEFSNNIAGEDVRTSHVHSGEVKEFSTTNPEDLAYYISNNDTHHIIFTTYHSLHRIVDSDIRIDNIYFDEAHHSTGRHFHEAVLATSRYANRRYYFTATPRIGRGDSKERGLDNNRVYGNTLEQTPAQELIKSGKILSPQIVPFDTDLVRDKHNAHDVDAENILNIVDSLEGDAPKILVAAPNTKVMWRMLSQTSVIEDLKSAGYDILHITSKHGAYVNQKKVRRDKFFQTLQDWGADDNKRFVVFHYSILSEGIDVPGLTHTVLLRNLPIIEMAQTIGRVIRVHPDDRKRVQSGEIPAAMFQFYKKPCGYVTVPMSGKLASRTHKRLQGIVDLIFKDGIPPISYAS